MIMPFDYDLAKEAVELGMGKIKTKSGRNVTVLNWTPFIGAESKYRIHGAILSRDSRNRNQRIDFHWTTEGKLHLDCDSSYDLVLEIYDDVNTV